MSEEFDKIRVKTTESMNTLLDAIKENMGKKGDLSRLSTETALELASKWDDTAKVLNMINSLPLNDDSPSDLKVKLFNDQKKRMD